MARRIDVPRNIGIEEYEAVAHLAPAVRELRERSRACVEDFEGRTVWMVNSTEHGGGVAEMLPSLVTLLRDLGVDTEWVVIESDRTDFFDLTKKVHNLIHGAGTGGLDRDAMELFASVNRENAEQMAEWLDPGDILVVHDPQPMPLASILRDEMEVDVGAIWRCHIGLDDENDATRAAWDFLDRWARAYALGVFSAPEYVPDAFEDRSVVVHPAINPLSQKNRELSVHKVVGVLANAALAVAPSPVLTPMYPHVARRLQPDGRWAPANMSEDIGLPTRPIVTQVSRWDRLKGWMPLLNAFDELKERARGGGTVEDATHRRRLELVRLVLAGPETEAVADDPESREVLDELCRRYRQLPDHVQRDVVLLSLPMTDPAQNALMVNAIHRSSSLVVQNSLREGFGLTVTEAMWKRVPVLTNSQACGPRQQVRHEEDGMLIDDPEDVEELRRAMDLILRQSDKRDDWGRNAQRRAHEHFLIFRQTAAWIDQIHRVLTGEIRGEPGEPDVPEKLGPLPPPA